MRAGSACILSQRTFHASHSNRSSAHRICASALAVPAESQTILSYETLDTTTHAIDVYPLDDEFYRLHVYGEPIVGGTPVAKVERSADPIWICRTGGRLFRCLASSMNSTSRLLGPSLRDARLRFRLGDGERLAAEDIADAIRFVVTRPRHVAVNEILVRPTEQER
jgi:hypothetical protein